MVTRKTLEQELEKRLGPALQVISKALKSTDEAIALRAAVDMLDRVGGKAIQRIDANVADTSPARIITPEMLRLAAQRLLASGATDAVEVDK